MSRMLVTGFAAFAGDPFLGDAKGDFNGSGSIRTPSRTLTVRVVGCTLTRVEIRFFYA